MTTRVKDTENNSELNTKNVDNNLVQLNTQLEKVSMKIAICCDISQFHRDQLQDRNWSKQFLGSAWITSLYERQKELGIEIASGDVALQKVKYGQWRAEDVHVVQEMDARHGLELCQLGAIPSVLTMLESPLVAYRSVDRLMRIRVTFAHCIGPKVIFESIPALRNSQYWRLSFPSYWRDQLPAQMHWPQRKYAILIAANKYWRERKWSQVRRLKDALRIFRHGIRKYLSSTYQSCWKLQLHDNRIDFLALLGTQDKIDVFGRGWENIGNLPVVQAEKIKGISNIFKGTCENKHELLSNYKFTIAYENTAYPGYVTEKIVDAIVSGSIPVYMGAPDILEQLPADTFIDARELGSVEAIATRMEEMTESEAIKMIAAGQRYLQTSLAQRYTYEGYADWVVSLISGKKINK